MTQQALQGGCRSEAQAAVLRALDPEPLTSAEISRRVGFSWESVRWALNRLLAQGLVERSALPGEGTRGSYGWRPRDGAKGE